MSRVFDVPRYKNQTLFKILTHVDVACTNDRNAASRVRSYIPAAEGINEQTAKYFDAVYEDIFITTDVEPVTDFLDEYDMYGRYSTMMGMQRTGHEARMQTERTGRILIKVLDEVCKGGRKLRTDADAMFRIVEGFMGGRYVGATTARRQKTMNIASTLARDIVSVSLAACRHGADTRSVMSEKVIGPESGSKLWKRMIAWTDGMETVRMKSMTREMFSAHEQLRGGDDSMDAEAFEAGEGKVKSMLGMEAFYRVMGIYIMVFEDCAYAFDYSSIDQIHQIAKSSEGMANYSCNYRPSGQLGSDTYDMRGAVESAFKWLSKALVDSDFNENLARSMKQSVAFMQNELHSKDEVLDVGYEKKSAAMRVMIAEIMDLDTLWHDFLYSLNIPDRARMDLANLYYALPAPDCDMQLLFQKVQDMSVKAHTANPERFKEFMNYCKALDFCKATVAFGESVTYKCTEGYEFKDSKWYKSCVKKRILLPPDEEMGNVWIEGFFPYTDTLPTWYWEASDVTRTDSCSKQDESLIEAGLVPRFHANELLWALEKAPELSGGIMPNDVYSLIASGNDTWDRRALIAGKAENTKPGYKVRETWSADAITRELTTTYDRCAIPLCTLYPGVTARKSDYEVQKSFDKLCEFTTPGSSTKVVIISNDVSGWSTSGDREAWSEHHDYLVRTTKAPAVLRMKYIWNGIKGVMSRRGYLNTTFINRGLFQGWTGTCDSLFNLRISLFCVRIAKRKGILLDSEAAVTAALIDDAVQAVKFDTAAGVEHAQAAADDHFKTTTKVWDDLGAEIDTVKTIYSSIKFIYLNRLFCQGAELMLPMKVYAKADKEYNRRYAPVTSQIDTILGAYRSAVDKGACPLASYYFAVRRCVEILAMSCHEVNNASSIRIVNAAFAPRGLGGWGIPHITGWLTQESQDDLTRYTTTMLSLASVVNNPAVSNEIVALLVATLNQEPAVSGIFSIIANPRGVVAEAVPDAGAGVVATLRHGMAKKCKSELFSSALNRKGLEHVEEATRDYISSLVIDASILELMGQCTPEACVSALVDRAYKNELITQLFPFQTRSKLSDRIKAGSYAAARHLLDIKPVHVPLELGRSDAFQLAHDCRERFYEKNGLTVVNHTVPDYPTSVARQSVEGNASITLTFKKVLSSCPGEGINYANLYEGTVSEGRARSMKSKSAYTFTGEKFKTMTPVQKCINKAAIVSAYVSQNGGNGQAYWNLIMALWGAKTMMTPPVVTQVVKEGTSTKRLSPSASHHGHSIVCFRNTQASVSVDAVCLARYLDRARVHVDYLSYLTSMRAIGLIELACSKDYKSMYKSEMFYAFIDGALPETNPDVIVVSDPARLVTSLESIRSHADPVLFSMVLDTFMDVKFTDNEEYTAIHYGDAQDAYGRAKDIAKVAPGYLTNLLSAGIMAPTSVRKNTKTYSIAADELKFSSTKRAESRFRTYCTVAPASQSLLAVMMETVKDLCAGDVVMEIAVSKWNTVGTAFEAKFPDYKSIWDNVRSMAKRFLMEIDEAAVNALFGPVSFHIKNTLRYLCGDQSGSASTVLAYLYLASWGRMRTPESYMLTSVMGMQHIARCWKLAAKIRKTDKSETETGYSKRLAARIYQAAGMSASTKNNKIDVYRASISALASYMIEKHEYEMPDVVITTEATFQNDERFNFIHNQMTYMLNEYGYNGSYVADTIKNIRDDTRASDNIKAIGSDMYGPKVVGILDQGIEFNLPTVEEAMKAVEEVTDDEIGEYTSENEVRKLKMIANRMDMDGLPALRRIWEGIDEFDLDFEPTEEELNEAREYVREMEQEKEAGHASRPDEV